MLQWTRNHSRSGDYMTAWTPTGHRFRISITETAAPVRLTMKKWPRGAEKLIAKTPTIDLAILCAEQLNIFNLRHRARPKEDSKYLEHEQQSAAKELEQIRNGPKVRFVIEVPEQHSMLVQETIAELPAISHIAPCPPLSPLDIGACVPPLSIHDAVRRVNQDLEAMGLSPVLKRPESLGRPDHPEKWLDFLHQEYLWTNSPECSDLGKRSIRRRLWGSTPDEWRETAAKYPEIMTIPAERLLATPT